MTAGRTMTREDVARRIVELPAGTRAQALALAVRLYGDPSDASGARAQASRDPDERRAYAGDPWAYFSDILGIDLTGQQEESLQLIEKHDRVLIPAGNNLGKTFTLAGYGIYRLDAVAALPDEAMGLPEQGGRVLLPGPDHGTIFQTIYAEMLTLASRAEVRGYRMPGSRSEKSVSWRVRAKWHVEAFSPPQSVQEEVAHQASGRHHRNQVALIEEGQGVDGRVWRAAEGMCSSPGNKIVSTFNPTEPVGPAYQRARAGGYRVLHLSAFDHPNVRKRRDVVPDAVDFRRIDDRVKTECRDRGPYPSTPVEEDHGEFVYALPPPGSDPESGPREDGHPGDPDGELRVYRPGPTFSSQVLGQWPEQSDRGLFDPGPWDKAVRRWRDQRLRTTRPDRVGVDAARRGEDENVACPAWGETAGALLEAFASAQDAGPGHVEKIRKERRAYVGELQVLGSGDGPEVAGRLARAFGDVPYNIDEGGVGASVLDHTARVIGYDAAGVSFGASPPEPTPGEPWSEDLRTAMYVRAARLVNLGLADPPDDPLLREEVMAQRVEHRTRTVRTKKKTRRVPSVKLEKKKEVKKRIGRSPDRADAFVLSLHGVSATKYDPDDWTTVKR